MIIFKKLHEKVCKSNDDNRKKLFEFFNEEKTLRDNFEKKMISSQSAEISNLDSNLQLKINEAVKRIEKGFIDKVKQLEMFKSSEELLGNNPFGSAIIHELTNRVFKNKEDELNNKEIELNKDIVKAKNEISKLENIKNQSIKNKISINKKLEEFEKDYHYYKRKIQNKNDDNEIHCKSLKHTISFIKWLVD